MPKRNILLAMFDIRPKGRSAVLILAQIKKELNLQPKNEPVVAPKPKTAIEKPAPRPSDDYWEELVARLPQRPDFPLRFEFPILSKSTIIKELERAMLEPLDIKAEMVSVGGIVHENKNSRPRSKVVSHSNPPAFTAAETETETEPVPVVDDSEEPATGSDLENFWNLKQEQSAAADGPSEYEAAGTEPEVELAASADLHSPASREIDVWLENLQKNRQLLSSKTRERQKSGASFGIGPRIKPKWSSWFRFNRNAMVYIAGIAMPGLLIFGLVKNQGGWARNNIIQNGNNAAANLEDAKHELENFNFTKAADSFALAYDDLNKASGTLNQLGASFIDVFGNLPGLSKVRAANNLVEAGQSLSKAGENLSLAFGTLYKTNLLSFLSTSPVSRASSLAGLLTEFKDILLFADKNVKRADGLLADIDASVIPADKQELFLNFKEKIPEFKKYIGEAVDYSDFLLKFVGVNGTKTYLILLQNNSELRPTGGFPGTYGLITFEDGALKKIFVEDVYRADANLKENIIPPVPLQHITPNWGMRDAAWFADFPTSARKVMEFYKLDGGPDVDGVLTITPDVITQILDVIGPIEMPEYKLTLNSDNFLAAIQNEVEYEADRSAPKQILSDLQPKFFERLAKQDKDHWLSIFKIISQAAERKHMLAYFNSSDLEDAALKNGLAGEIRQATIDYLQVVFANVKGSKTDFVTENSMNLAVEQGGGDVLNHTLSITRAHNGGDSKFGFYNRENPAYVKVYVPLGATLSSVRGQSITDFRSLIGHEDFGFKKDPDLARIEDGSVKPFSGVDVFEESGRTVFGFWLITKPKETKTVVLKYQTSRVSSNQYKMFWQKQSGTGDDRIGFNFKVPGGKRVINQTDGLQTLGDSLALGSDLSVDREIDLELR